MKTIKVSELTGAALDWAVATANGDCPQWDADWKVFYPANGDDMDYSTNWAQGGPIIEREDISTTRYDIHSPLAEQWRSYCKGVKAFYGKTLLESAMRCYVASKLGDTVEVPEELAT